MSDVKKHLRKSLTCINKYVPGKSIEEIAAHYGYDASDILKLGSNENQLGPSPHALKAVKQVAASTHLYPDVDAITLKTGLSRYTGLPENNIVVSGSGMDGVFDTIMRLFMREGKKAIIPTPTFSYYAIATLANGGTPVFIPRKEDFSIDTTRLTQESRSASIIFLCSPNNPTGNVMPERELREILESVNALVFLDEAYVEFADESYLNLVLEYDNLVVGRTFSKAFGLAGLRIGYAGMPEEIQKEYMKAATPFSVSKIAEHAGVAALHDTDHMNQTLEMVRKGRLQLHEGLTIKTYPSKANFILANTHPHTASMVTGKLLEQGIIIRDCTSFKDAGEHLIRITIGTQRQNQQVIKAINKLYTP